jgi:hypothetical protein
MSAKRKSYENIETYDNFDPATEKYDAEADSNDKQSNVYEFPYEVSEERLRQIEDDEPEEGEATGVSDEDNSKSRLQRKKSLKSEKTFRQQAKSILKSHKFHMIIIGLIVLDCICCIGELAIDFIESEFIHKNMRFNSLSGNHIRDHQRRSAIVNASNEYVHNGLNNSNKLFDTILDSRFAQNDNIHRLDRVLTILETCLKYTSLAILSMFLIEIIFKVIFVPKIFIKSKWEIPDAIVVISSFTINLILIHKKHAIHTIGGLILILRLNWILLFWFSFYR